MLLIGQINELEEVARKLTDEQLRGTTADLKKRVAEGQSLDSVLPVSGSLEAVQRTCKASLWDHSY